MSWGMSKDWPMGAQFWEQLTRTDLLWGERVRAGGCEDCGGPLDRADYPRKPRGGLGAESAGYVWPRALAGGVSTAMDDGQRGECPGTPAPRRHVSAGGAEGG